jgi:hypothetical protein
LCRALTVSITRPGWATMNCSCGAWVGSSDWRPVPPSGQSVSLCRPPELASAPAPAFHDIKFPSRKRHSPTHGPSLHSISPQAASGGPGGSSLPASAFGFAGVLKTPHTGRCTHHQIIRSLDNRDNHNLLSCLSLCFSFASHGNRNIQISQPCEVSSPVGL